MSMKKTKIKERISTWHYLDSLVDKKLFFPRPSSPFSALIAPLTINIHWRMIVRHGDRQLRMSLAPVFKKPRKPVKTSETNETTRILYVKPTLPILVTSPPSMLFYGKRETLTSVLLVSHCCVVLCYV